MKLFKSITIICLTLLFISCSSEDTTTGQITAEELAGTWKLTEVSQDGDFNTISQNLPLSIQFKATGKDIDAQVVFSQSPNNFVSTGSYTSVISITILTQTFNQETEISFTDFLNQGTWSANGSTITATQNGEAQTATVKQFDGAILKLEMEATQTLSIEGFDGDVDAKINFTLEKQ